MSPSTPFNPASVLPQGNPFASMAVGSPWLDAPADVRSIHQQAFQHLQNSYQQVQLGQSPISVAVTGEPGSGKTHLLSRLKRYLQEQSSETPWYVYVRCNASAQTIWRHLQRCLATDLLKAGQDSTSQQGNTSRFEEFLRQNPERILQANHHGLQRALNNLSNGRHTLGAMAWLRGEPLSPSDLEILGIESEKESEDRSRESEAKQVVEALLRVLSPLPIVLCFDQVEALETYPGDPAGYHAFGQMVSVLVDGEHRKLLLISCIVSDYEVQLESLPNKSDQDRLLQEKISLKPIEWEAAAELIRARLDQSPALEEQRAKRPRQPLWPLEEPPLRELFAKTGRCLPRKLIQACKAQFALRQAGSIIEPPLSREEFLQQEFQRLRQSARLEWRKRGGEAVLEDCLPWLLESYGKSVIPKSSTAPFVHLAFRGSAGESALLFCFTQGNPFTARLRKAELSWKGKPDLAILSDPAIQPKPDSRGAAHLEALKARGAKQIHPTEEALALLQAIRHLTTAARAGELNLDGETISEKEATLWALANLPAQVEALADELTLSTSGPRPPEDPIKSPLLQLLTRRKIMQGSAAAQELSLSIEEVSACARRHPLHFGILEGPPLVLFQVLEGSEPKGPDA